MRKRRQITWVDWSLLPSDKRKAIRKPLLKASRKSKPAMTCEEHKILMIPAPEDEEAIVKAVAADLRNYMRGNYDKAVKEEQNA